MSISYETKLFVLGLRVSVGLCGAGLVNVIASIYQLLEGRVPEKGFPNGNITFNTMIRCVQKFTRQTFGFYCNFQLAKEAAVDYDITFCQTRDREGITPYHFSMRCFSLKLRSVSFSWPDTALSVCPEGQADTQPFHTIPFFFLLKQIIYGSVFQAPSI